MAQVERLVDKTVAQTRGAADDYFNFVQKAFSFYPTGGTELAEKMKSYTEQNISAVGKLRIAKKHFVSSRLDWNKTLGRSVAAAHFYFL
jgi:hypothetical protein